MPLYEHVFISRQDLSSAQAEGLVEHFTTILADNGGKVIESEYWGVKTMAYKVNKNRKGHYALLKSDAPAAAVEEMERLMRLHDDVMRIMTIKVDSAPTVQMNKGMLKKHAGKSHRHVLSGSHTPKGRVVRVGKPLYVSIGPSEAEDQKSMSVKWLVENLADADDDVKEMVAQIESEAKELREMLDASNARVSSIISEIERRH